MASTQGISIESQNGNLRKTKPNTDVFHQTLHRTKCVHLLNMRREKTRSEQTKIHGSIYNHSSCSSLTAERYLLWKMLSIIHIFALN